MKQALLWATLLAALVGSSLARPNADQEAAIAAADQELMAEESSSSARSLESFTDLDKSIGPGKRQPGPKFIKYKGMKCLVEEPLPDSISKRSLKQARRSAASGSAPLAESLASGGASDTASNLFNMEGILSALSATGSNGNLGFGGLNLESIDGLSSSSSSSAAAAAKAKAKGKNSLVRFNFIKKILELIGLFVKVATDEKFLKDGNFLDFIKLCRETLLGFDKLDS